MLKKTVLVNKPIHPEALRRLEAQVHLMTPYEASVREVQALLVGVQGIVLCGGLSLGPADMDRACRLEVIGRYGVGLDNVDVAAASERGIPVTYTPYGPTESTAEHALALILATARRLSEMDRAVRRGDFDIRDRAEAMGCELEGKVLGVVGFGRIGRRLAQMCRDALRMSVLVFDPHLNANTVTDWGATPVESLTALVGQADVISIHTPLGPETYRLIGHEVLQAVKRGAILVNTSRGPVVDEQAVIEALQGGRLAGAGLDVYDPQPPEADSPLLSLEQVVLTPHIGSFTHEGRLRMGLTVVDDVLRALRGEQPRYLANPQVWERRRGKIKQKTSDTR